MKKSNIIIIITSSIMALLTIALLVLIKVNYKEVDNTIKPSVKMTENLNYSVIWIENSMNISIKQGEVPIIEIFEMGNDSINGKIEAVNDTLFIRSSKNPMDIVADSLQSIISNSSNLMLSNVKTDSLNVQLFNSEFTVNGNLELGKLKLTSRGGAFNFFNENKIANTLLISENAKAGIYGGSYGIVKIEAKDNSEVNFFNSGQVENLAYEKDSTSRFNMY